MSYDNTNMGILYRNDKKTDANPKWPDFQGTINVNGVEYELAGWQKEGREGTKMQGRRFFSLKVSKKRVPSEQQERQERQGAVEFLDDDIPF